MSTWQNRQESFSFLWNLLDSNFLIKLLLLNMQIASNHGTTVLDTTSILDMVPPPSYAPQSMRESLACVGCLSPYAQELGGDFIQPLSQAHESACISGAKSFVLILL